MGSLLIIVGVAMMVIGSVYSFYLERYDKLVRCVSLCTGSVVVMCGLANEAVGADAAKQSGADYVVRFVVFMLIAVIAGMRARHHYINRNHDTISERATSAPTIHRTIPSSQPQKRQLDDSGCDALTEQEQRLLDEIEANLIGR